MLSKMMKKNEKGFTLIELMIVIAIIGILAAIAIPQFNAYRKRSFNAAALSDLKNFTTAQEAYFVDAQTYCTTKATLMANYGAQESSGVTVTINSANASSYNMSSTNAKGDKTYTIVGPGGAIGN